MLAARPRCSESVTHRIQENRVFRFFIDRRAGKLETVMNGLTLKGYRPCISGAAKTKGCRFRRQPLNRCDAADGAVGMLLPGIAQARSDAVDRQVNAAPHAHVRIARTMALEQFDLQVIERIQIRETILD